MASVTSLPQTCGWQAIRDEKVRCTWLEAQIALRGLEAERNVLAVRRGQVETELERLGESEASVAAHLRLARWWGGLLLLALVVTAGSAWWSVNWYLSLTWEKALLVLTLFVLPLIGWMAFLMYARDRAQGRDLWRVFCGLGLLVALCSVGAVIFLGTGRMAGTELEETRRQVQATRSADELAPAPGDGDAQAAGVARAKRLLSIFTMLSVILLGVAGEMAAGLAFHEYVKRMTVVWTVRPFFRERAQLEQLLADNTAQQEGVRRRPELLHAQLTAEGLQQEAEAQRRRETAEARANSLGSLSTRVMLVFGLALVVLLAIAILAYAEEERREVTVVLIDLSTSLASDHEFARNLGAVEGLIGRAPAGGSRIVVLAICARSFGSPPLLAEVSPLAPGRFGEYLDQWRRSTVERWRNVARTLKPTAKGTDLFGALAQAEIEFEAVPTATKRLVVLSDMRHVGRGLNLERSVAEPLALVKKVHAKRLIPRLEGVRVWALGVHTAGFDEHQWRRLKEFWVEYFKQAEAELKAFTPNRRLGEQ